MTNRVQIHEVFKQSSNKGNFSFQATVLKNGSLLGGWKLATKAKFLHSISKIMPAMPKKYWDMD